MPRTNLRFVALALLFGAAPALAQTAPPSGPSPQGRQEPCWLKAGISRSVMEQRHSIEMDVHSQVASVCENSSLTPAQKREQVRQIHQQAQQKIDALVTPEQQSALHSCQQARATNGGANGRRHPAGAGPCANFAASQGRQGPANGQSPGSNPQPPANDSNPQN